MPHSTYINKLVLGLFNLRFGKALLKHRVQVFVDQSLLHLPGYGSTDIDRIRSSTSAWLEWTAIHSVTVDSLEDVVRRQVDSCSTSLLISSSVDMMNEFEILCEKHGQPHCVSRYPAFNSLEEAFFKEVLHHDFELGGKNEYDGNPTSFSPWVLRQLSAVHIRDFFPNYAIKELDSLRAKRRSSLRTLDIGCGPISVLRWGALQGLMHIIGVDPLLDIYRLILARHGLDKLDSVLCHEEFSLRAEELPMSLHAGTFDVVYTNNALDHTQDPLAVTTIMAQCLRPDGIAIIQVAANEGTRQNWNQLHKFNIRYENDRVVAINQAGEVKVLCGDGAPLALHRIISTSDEELVVIAQRGHIPDSLEQHTLLGSAVVAA